MSKGIMYVDGQRVAFDGEKNVLSVIRAAGIEMPTFCYYSDLSVYGACRMCVVEDEATGKIDTSCSMKPRDGLRIRTNTAKLLKHRRIILELLLSAHKCDCALCEKNGSCHLQELALQFGIRRVRFGDTREQLPLDDSSPAIVRDPNKCILCGDCVRVCEEVQGMNVIEFVGRGSKLRVQPAFNRKMSETNCISCGQCAAVCTTGAITIYNNIGRAWKALHDPKKRVVFQIAPAVRVAVGEAFGFAPGDNRLGKLVAALKMMGADEVFDTTFGADMTVIEEAHEFVERLKAGGPFPMFTSCCPAWVKYAELNKPELLKNISTCKSPMEMFAAVLRERYSKLDAEDGRETVHVAIMPCTAKKMEAQREEFKTDGKPDVDLVLTTIEIINMIKESGIRFDVLDGEAPDMPYGIGTGSATIFGTCGGVAEAVARVCAPEKTHNALKEIEFSGLRGRDFIKTATINIGERDIKIAVCHGLIHAQQLIADIEAGKAYYDLIEVMTCQTGCIGGAGQPHALIGTKFKRGVGLYDADRNALIKGSDANPVIQMLFDNELKGREHELLHVDYIKDR